LRDVEDGAGVRWTPLPLAEAPTEPTGENVPYGLFYVAIPGTGGVPYDLKKRLLTLLLYNGIMIIMK